MMFANGCSNAFGHPRGARTNISTIVNRQQLDVSTPFGIQRWALIVRIDSWVSVCAQRLSHTEVGKY